MPFEGRKKTAVRVLRPIEEKILNYSQLAPAERLELEAFVEAHRDLSPLLDEAKTWDVFFREAGIVIDEQFSSEAIAFFVVTQHTKHHSLPPIIQKVYDKMLAGLEVHPERKIQYEAFSRRMIELERAFDARTQFEKLTGHNLDDFNPVTPA